MHSLLRRQLKKHFGDLAAVPPELASFLQTIDTAYAEFDDDRLMLERSLELSSRELLQANSETRAILGALPDLFFRLARDGTILDAKGGRPDEFWLPPEALLGRRIQDVPDAEVAARFARAVAEVGERHALTAFEYALVRGGETTYYEARLLPVLESQSIAIIRNITERKEAEESARRRTERILRHQAALHDLALGDSADLAATLRRITDVAGRTLGLSRVGVWLYDASHTYLVCECITPAPPVTPASFLPERYPRYFAALEQSRTIAARDAVSDPRTSEFGPTHLIPRGVTSLLDVSVRLQGKIVGLVCCEHIGPMREWTLEEQDFAASIADLVSIALAANKRRQLEEQLRQSQKMEAIGLLAGGIAHDFNNLLTVILGSSELMLSQFAATPQIREHAEDIRMATERAAALTRQLLTFSRKQLLQPSVVDLNAVVDSLGNMLRRLVGEHIRLSLSPAPELWRVRADRGQIEQVLMNLVVNAREAMPEGGELTIETYNTIVDPSNAGPGASAPAGRCVVLRVSDTGCGMDAQTMVRIFEPFFTTKAVGQGTGLGLSTVYGIVQQAGGQIDVTSEPGRGATFRVTLPAFEAKALAPARPCVVAEHDLPAGGNETILLVEDEDMVRKFASRILSECGYDVLEAADPETALRISHGHRGVIHLMLTDVVMPQMNGRQLYERVAPTRPGMKVLYMSGYTDAAVLDGALRDPAVDLIQKPFTIDGLARRVRDTLDAPQRASA